MTIREYFAAGNVLIADTHNAFDYTTLAKRLNQRFGVRELREDVPTEQIAEIAQITVDINIDYLRIVFDNTVNPFKTWGESGTTADSANTNEIATHGGTDTTKNTGTNSTTDSGTSSAESSGTGTTNRGVYGYDSNTTLSPQSSDSTTDSNTTSGTTSGTSTTTLDTTAARTLDTNDTRKSTAESSGNYSKTGYNINDYATAVKMYYAPYDILINYIVSDICKTYFSLDREEYF